MAIVTEPAVYMVGRQQVDDAEVQRFLDHHGAAWETDSEVGGELLSEMGGRVCYMAFGAKQGRRTNSEYLGNIMRQRHGSVLEHAVWTFLITGVSRSLTHELVRHRAGFGFCLTGDTLIYGEHMNHGKRDGTKKWAIRDIYAMTQTPHGRSRLKLLRLRCLDEITHTFSTGAIAKVAYTGRKPVFRVELEGGRAITCSRDHRFLTPVGWQPLHEVVGSLDLSSGDLASYDSLEASIAVNGVLAYRDRDWLHEQYIAKNLEHTQIAELAGVSKHTFGALPADVIALGKLKAPVGIPRLTAHFSRITSIVYAGEQDTYDIEMAGPHHNFVANGIVTHNSQLSQRYVDETETDFVEPAPIAADPHLHGIWLEAIESARAAYVALSDALTEKLKIEQPEMKATGRRKAARQAARSVLPNATETKIFVTVNGRALRHFIELRGSEDAEPEIRTLAVALLRLMSREAPNMFGDFTLRTLADGSQATEVLHSKV